MKTPDKNRDYDINLVLENSKGKTCRVNPISPYCAYSRLVKDN